MKIKKIESVQAIRAIACLLVMYLHTDYGVVGARAVDFFFVISGFLMVMTTESGVEYYWIKKVKRLLPLYYFMTAITAIFVLLMPNLFRSYEVTLEYFVKSLLFIPYEHSGIQQPLLGLAWTLNYEMLFYAIFWIACKLKHKYRTWIATGIISLICLCGVFNLSMPFSFWTNNIMFQFIYGMLLYELYKRLFSRKKCIEKSYKKCVNVIVFVVALLVFTVGFIIMEHISIFAISGIVAAVIVFIWLIMEPCMYIPRWLIYIGDMSYLLYMMHMYPIRLMDMIVDRVLGANFVCAILSIVIATVIVVMFNELIYKKVQKKYGL